MRPRPCTRYVGSQMVLNQYAAMLNVVTVIAIAVVFRSAGPSISAITRHGDIAVCPAFFSCSQMSDSGICERMNTTINAGTADTMKVARQPIHGARKVPAIEAKKRANAEPLCRYEP